MESKTIQSSNLITSPCHIVKLSFWVTLIIMYFIDTWITVSMKCLTNNFGFKCTNTIKRSNRTIFDFYAALLHNVVFSFWQFWTVAFWITQPMAKLVTLLEQHLDRQPPTIVIQATPWWETVLAHVKLQECGLGVNLSVKVCCYWSLGSTY